MAMSERKQVMCECGAMTWRRSGVCKRCVDRMMTLIINFRREFGVDLLSAPKVQRELPDKSVGTFDGQTLSEG